jgi:hypothetical protein
MKKKTTKKISPATKKKPGKKKTASAKKAAKKKGVSAAVAKKKAPSAARQKPIATVAAQPKQPPFKPHPDKLDRIRQSVLTTLWKLEALPPGQLRSMLETEIAASFEGEFAAYYEYVMRLLNRFKLVEEIPGKIPVHIRLAQRIDD